jgi:hypothetical protein
MWQSLQKSVIRGCLEKNRTQEGGKLRGYGRRWLEAFLGFVRLAFIKILPEYR